MVNYLAVIVVTVIGFLISLIWYMPFLFGNHWQKLTKVKEFKIKPTGVFAGLISNFILSLILAFIIEITNIQTFAGGLILGAILWVGFIATTLFNEVLWEKRPFALYILNVTQYLIALVVSAGILASWQ